MRRWVRLDPELVTEHAMFGRSAREALQDAESFMQVSNAIVGL